MIFKFCYYRFKGFWFESSYKPYVNYKGFRFKPKDRPEYGLHNSFRNFNGNIHSKEEIKNKINSLEIDKNKFFEYFNKELEKFKYLDDLQSDFKMYDFFCLNYKKKRLFHDPFHPTNIFYEELFKKIVKKIDNTIINNLNLFLVKEKTDFSLPILPQIKKILNLDISDKFWVFRRCPKELYIDIYDYYYIALSKKNLDQVIKNNFKL